MASSDAGRPTARPRLGLSEEYRQVHRWRLKRMVDVREPLVVVSQIQRSGGTLLTQLFDGHPACHVHPGELHMGGKNKLVWPELSLDADPEVWFDMLFERKLAKYQDVGYSKAPRHLQHTIDYDVHPFLFVPTLQRDIFLRFVDQRGVSSARDIFDAWWTSVFNAWLDNQNLYAGDKKAVVGFAAGFLARSENLDPFFEIYPDGFVISIVRDPRGWFSSARRYKPKFENLDWAIERWRESTGATLAAREQWGERIAVVTYDDLVLDTEKVMRRLANAIGAGFSPELLTPTFNGLAIRADSSDPVSDYGVLKERATAHRDALDSETVSSIDRLAGDLYERACEAAAGPAGVSAGGSGTR